MARKPPIPRIEYPPQDFRKMRPTVVATAQIARATNIRTGTYRKNITKVGVR
jgi:hypothetical protein